MRGAAADLDVGCNGPRDRIGVLIILLNELPRLDTDVFRQDVERIESHIRLAAFNLAEPLPAEARLKRKESLRKAACLSKRENVLAEDLLDHCAHADEFAGRYQLKWKL